MSKSGSGPHALPQQERARDRGGDRTNTPRIEYNLKAPRRRTRRSTGVPLAPYSSFNGGDGSKLRLQVSPDVRRWIIDQHGREGRSGRTGQQVDPDLRIRQNVGIAFGIKNVQCRDVPRAPLDEGLGHGQRLGLGLALVAVEVLLPGRLEGEVGFGVRVCCV